MRVLEKAGFKKGRLYQNHYRRAVDSDTSEKRAMQLFYLDRPLDKYKDKGYKNDLADKRKRHNEDDDAETIALRDAVTNMLGFGGKDVNPTSLRERYMVLDKKQGDGRIDLE